MDTSALTRSVIIGTIALSVLAIPGAIPVLGFFIFCCMILPGLFLIGASYSHFAKQNGQKVEVIPAAMGGGLATGLSTILPTIIGAVISVFFSTAFGSAEDVAGNIICFPFVLCLSFFIAGFFGAIGGALYSVFEG